jgi:hypothetical protein
MGASLAAETNESQDGESRLKAGCSQDWLPHKARGFLGSNLRRRASSFIGRGNLDRRSRRHTRQPLTGREACPTLQSTPQKIIPQNQRIAMSFQSVNAARAGPEGAPCATKPLRQTSPKSFPHHGSNLVDVQLAHDAGAMRHGRFERNAQLDPDLLAAFAGHD